MAAASILAPPMLDPSLRATFEACLDALRRGDGAALEGCFREDAEGSDSLGGEARGATAAAGNLARWAERMPGLEVAPLRTYGEGPELAARVRLAFQGREAEGALAFRFDAAAKIERLVALFEPAPLMGVPHTDLSKAHEDAVIEYFRSYNSDEEDRHMTLLSPDLIYFGSVSRMTAEGIGTARGIFRSARDRMGLKRFDPIRTFGGGPWTAVLVRIHGAKAGGPTEEGLWLFRFDAQARFDRVSILWNPGAFLAWPARP